MSKRSLFRITIYRVTDIILYRPNSNLKVRYTRPRGRPFPTMFTLVRDRGADRTVRSTQRRQVQVTAPDICRGTRRFVMG